MDNYIGLKNIPIPNQIGLLHLRAKFADAAGTHIQVKCLSQLNQAKYRKSQFSFFKFPGAYGWTFSTADGGLQTSGDQDSNAADYSESWSRIIQHWLFFKLLEEVFDFLDGFKHEHFYLKGQYYSYVTTQRLPEYVEQWRLYETSVQERDKGDQTRRFVHVQRVLSFARSLVHQYCSVERPKMQPTWSNVDQNICLSLMVLGETLTRANIEIQRSCKFALTGWHDYEIKNQGWGFSQLALDNLSSGWCKKTIAMLQALSRENSIGLVHADSLPMKMDPKQLSQHMECDYDRCYVERPKSASLGNSEESKITLRHSSRCERNGNTGCREIQIDSGSIAAEVKLKKLPLLQLIRDNNQELSLELTSIDWPGPGTKKPPIYHVFSHVWSDHFGDQETNTINKCLLAEFDGYFREMERKKPSSTTSEQSQGAELFWIDTLTIPNGKDWRPQRNEVVQRMHEIYFYGKNTIVLDTSLMSENLGLEYAFPAMMITMSAWLRRLWTLQEAVFSKEIWFLLKEGPCLMNDLELQHKDDQGSLCAVLSDVSRAYYDAILGDIRKKLHEDGGKVEVNTALIEATWKACQWRSTAWDHHESLALAILFDLDLEDFATHVKPGDKPKPFTRDELDARMHKVVQQLSKKEKLVLPSGIIFLPGPHLPIPAYGWAPRTWLSSCDVHRPDPLSLSIDKPARWREKGLEVKYPGFRLHDLADFKERRLLSLKGYREIQFPIHYTLSEWYVMKPVEPFGKVFFPTIKDDHMSRLAIINARLPLKSTKEIALLVVIRDEHQGHLEVHVICQVWISKVQQPEHIERYNDWYDQRESTIRFCGEKLPETTWIVDALPQAEEQELNGGPEPKPISKKSRTMTVRDMAAGAGHKVKELGTNAVQKIGKSFTWQIGAKVTK